MASPRPQRPQRAARSQSVRVRGETNGGVKALGRSHITEIQRSRIVAATFEVVAELGAGGVSVADVVTRSGVSRRTFYEVFADRGDCLGAAFEQALESVAARVVAAYEAKDGWRERIRAGVMALLSFLDEQPLTGRFLLVESQACGARVMESRNRAMRHLVRAVADGEAEMRVGAGPPPLVAEGAVGGALSILQTEISNPAHEPLINLTNALVGMIVLPYLGSAAALRELDREVQSSSVAKPSVRPPVDPFKHAGLRLTYRTVRVLVAIAELSEADGKAPSNRQIGARAGVSDQGQISKLLRRLARAALIENAALGPGQGAPNAWTLTETGRQMTDSITAHTGQHGLANDFHT